ncbi:MAG: BrnT family toxin, partial [Spirochaetales bacterium]|nr:BrnT family toxin [Spirochaetales bacterium]
MRYEWDQHKNFANQRKYGISFDEAIEIFDDPLHVSILDEKYSYFEER